MMEVECPRCGGNKKLKVEKEWVDCPNCAGTGKVKLR